jgi:RND family efflux transporter MFP subunit
LSGIVNRLFIEEGQYLSDAAPVADIIQINRVKVKVGIPESDVDAVRHLNVFEVKIDALGGKTFRAKKHFLSNTADSMARLYNLNLVIENVTKEILPDMFARVEIVKKEILNGISVPIYAVINRSKEKIVYIVNDKHVRTRKVELGLLDGWRVQIKSGLKKGDRVIVVGQRNVNPGQEVKIVRSIKDMEDLMK